MLQRDMQDQFSWKPEPESGFTVQMVHANGLDFEVAMAGEGKKLALCLHGFPELHYSWRHQIPQLVEMGYKVWAPNLRGYGSSSKPGGVDSYRLNILVQDIAALIDASQAEEVTLIAHDWGAIIAWHFAILKIRPLAKLVIMNVPHPKCAQREIRHWHQLKKSWYIFFFQLPWLPEKILRRNKAQPIKEAFSKMAVDKSRFPDSDLQVYADAASRPDGLRSMINYYRALVRTKDGREIGDAMVHIPTLMIWGEEDTALDIRCTDGTDQWVPNFELYRLPGVSHWVQQEAPEKVNAILRDWLAD
ncbi:MAG: alpha/beta hydrolase [Parasphingorhabdus sp.]|uniref:alpha/beta fold hydrolase n=1 Tax=Parasphingorhabdus sp. TaxID=2709688 RepID=UPI00329865EA